MNLSAPTTAEVPPGVLSVTSTVPALWLGEVTEQLVVDVQLMAVAPLVPNLAVVAPATNPAPVTLTTVRPATGPDDGLTEVIVGTGS